MIMLPWTLECVRGTWDKNGAWRHHRLPYIPPSATDKGNDSLHTGEVASQVPEEC